MPDDPAADMEATDIEATEPRAGAASQAATADAAATDADGTIHFHFPIDIQIVGGVDSGVVDAVVARVFDELRRELERSA